MKFDVAADLDISRFLNKRGPQRRRGQMTVGRKGRRGRGAQRRGEEGDREVSGVGRGRREEEYK